MRMVELVVEDLADCAVFGVLLDVVSGRRGPLLAASAQADLFSEA
jgi:hypothetical protein